MRRLFNKEQYMSAFNPPIAAAAIEDQRLAISDSSTSGVSWGAIFVGAAAAAALSLILMVLGFGLGLSAVSPWSNSGASATAMGASTIAWLAFTQLTASAIGGYLAGRLRVKWVRLHTDEVYFRDTAHGFMAWAVASLVTAALLGSAVASILSGGVQAGASMAAGMASGATIATSQLETTNAQRLDYYVDALFRKDGATSGTPLSPSVRAEALQVFANNMRAGALSNEDRQYLGSVIAQQTGIAPADAEKRAADKFNQMKIAINDAENSARQAADSARKIAAHSSLWMFVALMLGAFFASLAATFGGQRRDNHA
jgi:hypothetical protein